MTHARPTPRRRRSLSAAALASVVCCGGAALAGETTANFDTDPGWLWRFNNLVPINPPMVTQNFGFSATSIAGGSTGELGGTISRSTTPAWYAAPIADLTLNDTLTASGKISMPAQNSGAGLHFGWFNDEQQGWRPWSQLGFRLDGRGSFANVLLDVMTQTWKADGINAGNLPTPLTIPFDGSDHTWTLSYNPSGNGTITFTLDNLPPAVMPLPTGFKAEGAIFNRFGLLNQQVSSGPMQVYLDDIQYNGVTQNFNSPATGWEEVGNRVAFPDPEQRGAHNFGYRTTNYAGGAGPGEVGGLVWRAAPHEEPYYGAAVQDLSLDTPLRATGKVAFRRGSSDGGMYFGWFNKHSIENSVDVAPQIAEVANFMGVTIEGPSSVGWYFRPIYASSTGAKRDSQSGPLIYPDLESHDFEIRYLPGANNGDGLMIVRLDGVTRQFLLTAGDRAAGATFDRFGLFSLSPDGHYVEVFFDDLSYTSSGGPQWVGGSGDWQAPGNWHGGVPGGAGAAANFLWGTAAPTTIVTDTAATVGSLRFDNDQTYVIGGTGSLTVQVDSGDALIDVLSGTHKINLPTHFASNTTLSVASGATLKLSDPVFINAGVVLNQSGEGNVVYESTVTVLDGALLRIQSATVSLLRAGGLSISATASLDLTDNAAAIRDIDSSTVRQMIRDGRITSSLSDPERRLGYADNAVLGLTELHGQSVDADSTLIAFTYAGDANLDGRVDIADLGALASHWQSSAEWIGGDFDYNGIVDVADLGMLASNWQAGSGTLPTAEPWALAEALQSLGLPSVSVPEPAVSCVALLFGIGLRRRRYARAVTRAFSPCMVRPKTGTSATRTRRARAESPCHVEDLQAPTRVSQTNLLRLHQRHF